MTRAAAVAVVRRWTVVLLLLVSGVACVGDPAGSQGRTRQPSTQDAIDAPALKGDLTVFAASSLTEAFNDIKADLEAASPDLTIACNFAGSQQLVTQLAQGANADILALANQSHMRAARDDGAIAGEPVVFARNKLAIVVPRDNPAGVAGPADLANEGLKLVVANPDVPAGRYSLDALDLMTASGDPAFGADFRSRVEANIVSREDNVRQVVSKVQLGEADAGIVYVTDVTAHAGGDVASIDIPDALNVIVEYPIAAVTGGDGNLARAFIDYLLSDAGQATLAERGFLPVR